jgi:hypothetical protein
MTTINERALLMGWVCSRRLMAPARQNPAKRTNKIRCIEVEGESFPIVNELSCKNIGSNKWSWNVLRLRHD